MTSNVDRCVACRDGEELGFEITMAFQPIVDLDSGTVFAHEALVRGLGGESAAAILARVDAGNRYRFDQACRVKAIECAAALGLPGRVSINFLPNAVYRPELCIRATLAAAERHGFPVDRLIFELTEGERIEDVAHVRNIVQHYRQRGFLTALDDFGAGYAGLNLLADLQTDLLKLDMALIRDLDHDRGRRAIVRGIVQVCQDLGIRIIAEGVESGAEVQALRDLGIALFQGYWFARPQLGVVPVVEAGRLVVA